MGSSWGLGSSFSWLLITARCGVCFRRIMFPTLTTVLLSPGDLYNCTKYEHDVWIASHLYLSMRTAECSWTKSPADPGLLRLHIHVIVVHKAGVPNLTTRRCVLVCLQDLIEEVKQLKSKVGELEGEKSQYERKLRATKVKKTLWTCYMFYREKQIFTLY